MTDQGASVPGEQHLFEPPPPIDPPPPPPPEPIIVKGKVKVRIDFEADLAALIAKHRDRYDEVDLQGGDESDRPEMFLYDIIEHLFLEASLYGEGITERWTDVEIDIRVKPDQTAELNRRITPIPQED